MANDKEQKTLERWALPEARVINNSLFKKDKYNDKATASYKIEVAIRKDDPACKALFDKLFDIAAEAFPKLSDKDLEQKINGGKVKGVLDGDVQAKKREAKDKQGDAYKGTWVIRAHTIYDATGNDGDGGVEVFDEKVERIMPVNGSQVYNGSYGVTAVAVKGWSDTDDDTGELVYGLTFYLCGFQKTKDGDKLSSGGSSSSLFKPVGRAPKTESGEGGGERRRRAA